MRRIKFSTNIFLLALLSMILFLPVSTAIGYEGGCPGCGGYNRDKGCCDNTMDGLCKDSVDNKTCDIFKGVFHSGDFVCDTETQCEKPTAIRLSSFNVTQQNGQNFIFWITGTEIDTEGFHILRSTSPGGPYSRITPSLVVSTGSAFAGGRYSFVDMAVENGKGYYYKLEEVDSRGITTQYGPVAAVALERNETFVSQDTKENNPPSPPFTKGGKVDKEKEDVAAGSGYPSEGWVVRPQTTTTPVYYTIMAYTDGPAKFLSGEVVDEETVQGIRSQVLDPPHLTSPQRGEGNAIPENEIASASPRNDAPSSIRFRIIDADGNEVAVASLDLDSPAFRDGIASGTTFPRNDTEKGVRTDRDVSLDARSGDFALQKRWYGDRVILTWYATEPVKGFHILRGTKKDNTYQRITKTLIPYIGTGIDGVTGQIFRFTYTDRNVQKGKDYDYRLEAIKAINKSALR